MVAWAGSFLELAEVPLPVAPSLALTDVAGSIGAGTHVRPSRMRQGRYGWPDRSGDQADAGRRRQSLGAVRLQATSGRSLATIDRAPFRGVSLTKTYPPLEP